jgi:hypothetical protein
MNLSELKMMLIEQQTDFKASFKFPDLLLNTITESIGQADVH